MNLLKVIFLFILVNYSFCAIAAEPAPLNAAERHADLAAMSWHHHFLQQLRHMETVGEGQFTPIERREILKKFARGHLNNDTPIPTPNGSEVRNLFDEGYLENQIMGINLINFAESGLMPKFPLVGEGRPLRDRRLNAGLVLTLMDIVRQQPLTTPLFEGHGGLENNDLLKVKELSGTFWRWDGNPDHIDAARELFSGMIKPNQPAGGATFDVISCFHGIRRQELNQLYFLPKGADRENPSNFFQVQTVQVGGIGAFLDQGGINPLYTEWNTSEWRDIFTKSDYTIIRISNHSIVMPDAAAGAGRTLRGILNERGLIDAAHNRVKNLRGAGIEPFNPTRVFAFGKPGSDYVQAPAELDPDGFCLVSDVEEDNAVTLPQNSFRLVHPLRRVVADTANTYDAATENIDPAPENVPILNKIATSIPLTHGMSGGPVLRCAISEEGAGHIHCQFLGSVSFGGIIEHNEELFFKGSIAFSEEE
ncbi:MAG: hypothetical protein K2W94_06880 [Alphaproteobacteria bacterium]|nr:hypothetical protein [Alphaproteobacteria bacterium]